MGGQSILGDVFENIYDPAQAKIGFSRHELTVTIRANSKED